MPACFPRFFERIRNDDAPLWHICKTKRHAAVFHIIHCIIISYFLKISIFAVLIKENMLQKRYNEITRKRRYDLLIPGLTAICLTFFNWVFFVLRCGGSYFAVSLSVAAFMVIGAAWLIVKSFRKYTLPHRSTMLLLMLVGLSEAFRAAILTSPFLR